MWITVTSPHIEVPKGKILLTRRRNGDISVSRGFGGTGLISDTVVAYTIIDDYEVPIKTISRWSEPTQEDLKNGPIECEVKSMAFDWVERRLLTILPEGNNRFATVNPAGQTAVWEDCRISNFPKEAKWLAKDAIGHWWWYSEKPVRNNGVWRCLGSAGGAACRGLPDCDWQDSLIEIKD